MEEHRFIEEGVYRYGREDNGIGGFFYAEWKLGWWKMEKWKGMWSGKRWRWIEGGYIDMKGKVKGWVDFAMWNGS